MVVSLAGDYGKPRPALVIQSDATLAVTGSVTFCLLTSELVSAPWLRIDVAPSSGNGLRRPSQIQIDKIYTLPEGKVGERIGTLERGLLDRVSLSLALQLDLIAPQEGS